MSNDINQCGKITCKSCLEGISALKAERDRLQTAINSWNLRLTTKDVGRVELQLEKKKLQSQLKSATEIIRTFAANGSPSALKWLENEPDKKGPVKTDT